MRREKVLLYFSLAFLSLSIGCLVDGITSLVSLSVFVSFFWVGIIEMLSPGILSKYSDDLKYLSLVPIVAYLYLSTYSQFIVLLIDALIMVVIAFLVYLEKDRTLKFVPFLIILFALLTFGIGVYPEIVFKVQVIIAIILGYLITVNIFKVTIPVAVQDKGINIKPGIVFMKNVPEEILKTSLIFSRNPGGDNERWFWITKVQKGPRTVEPTNLVKILNLAVRYLEQGGTVVIDGIEYLILENGFDSVLKFLANLRDYAMLYNSTVIIVSDLTTFSEKERKLLLRVIGEET
ncbi:DUF835 domain-containing protein [Thermococcus chitonophagus]|nr:DUF835 domain-containing protein [Thermococcus chitonophagus]